MGRPRGAKLFSLLWGGVIKESLREAKPPCHTLPLSFEGEGDKGGEVRENV